MKKIHRTRAELLRELNYTVKCRRNSYSASFSGLSVYLTHILVFQEKWRPGQIQKLYQAITDGLADESFDIDTANARLKEKTGVAFEVVRHEDSDIHISKKKKYRYMIVQKLNEAEDEICTYCMRWCLITYSYLMDNGFGKKRITRINDALKECLEKSESGVMDSKVAVMRQELIDAGYIIEVPKEWILLRSRT